MITMIKISIQKIFVFMFVKYFIFYIYMMIKTNNYTLIEFNNINSTDDLIYYLLLFLPLPILSFILFTVPIKLAFNSIHFLKFFLIIIFIFFVEGIIYTYLASQTNYLNGLFNFVISIITLFILFYSELKLKYWKKT